MRELTGLRVLLTGASRGIGRATAEALVRAGAYVGLVSRNRDELHELANTLTGSGECVVLPCDVSSPIQVNATIGKMADMFGGIDALINNAGAFREGNIEELSLENWELVQKVNVTGPFLLCKGVFPYMKKAKGGRIINVASTAGKQGYLYQSAYSASKHALIGLGECVAAEGKPHNIHVTNLCPGGVRTDFVGESFLFDRLSKETLIEPEDLAEMIVFLLAQPDNLDISELVVKRCHIG